MGELARGPETIYRGAGVRMQRVALPFYENSFNSKSKGLRIIVKFAAIAPRLTFRENGLVYL